jgi:hypothetical protein
MKTIKIFTLIFSVIHFPNVSFGVDLDDALNSIEKKGLTAIAVGPFLFGVANGWSL